MKKNTLVAIGKQAFEEKNYSKAENMLLKAIDMDGVAYPDVFYILGLISHFNGEINRGVTFFKKAIELNPYYVEALLGLSITLNDMGKYRESREFFRKAVGAASSEKKSIPDGILKPKIVNHLKELGRLYISINRYSDAIGYLEKALDIAPDYPDIKLELASALRDSGKYERAKQLLEDVLKVRPGNVSALLQIGLIYYLQQDPSGASHAWEKALAKDPTNRLISLYLNSTRKTGK